MRRRLPAGLRWRLLLALLVTSAITLGATALVVLPPMQERLRTQSADSLRDAVRSATPAFADVYRTLYENETNRFDYRFAFSSAAADLNTRADARVLVMDKDSMPADTTKLPPGFVYDIELGDPSPRAVSAALRTMREELPVTDISGDDVIVAMPLFVNGDLAGALVADRQLSEVATLVDQVQTRFLIAAAVGLLVATLLAIALSSTLLRRLGRLRAAALRISDEGPETAMPRDERRDEVGDLARALARMQEELRRQETARRAFVATASHELRTPLTMLQGTMELLEEDVRGGQIDELDALRQVATARRQLDRLSVLASELLDLSRLDAAVPLRAEPVELGELVRAVAAEFELRARERSTSIDVILPERACWGQGDPDAVARVVRILLDNALRYGPRGRPVRVEADARGPRASITVTDEGPGIPEAERDHIFERFHRGASAGPAGGFGLGLAIGRELARRMGGELDVVDGGGTRFALTLRTARSPADEPRGDRDRVNA